MWHERLVALMGLPVVMQSKVRGDTVVRGASVRVGAEQFALVLRSADDADAPSRDPGRSWRRPPPTPLPPSTGSSHRPTDDWSPTASAKAAPKTARLRVLDVESGQHPQPIEIPDTRASTVAWLPDSSRASTTPPIPTATSTTGACCSTRSARPATTTPSCGAIRRRRSRGPMCRSLPMAVSCSSRCSSAGAASMPSCSIAATDSWTTRHQRPRGDVDVQLRRRRVARHHHASRRQAVGSRWRSFDAPTVEHWRTIVPESGDVIGRAHACGDEILVHVTRSGRRSRRAVEPRRSAPRRVRRLRRRVDRRRRHRAGRSPPRS